MSSTKELVIVNLEDEQPELRELDERKDSFGNNVRLLWDPSNNTVHLSVAGVLVEVPREKAVESFDDHIPVLASHLGWSAIEGFTAEAA